MTNGIACLSRRVMAAIAFALAFVWVSTDLGQPVQAQPPTENPVISLSVDPDDPARVVVGTLNSPQPGGIYYSEDGGVSWDAASGLPVNVSIAALEHDVVNPAIVYAGDAAAGLFFRSTDGGQSFQDFPAIGTWLSLDSGIGLLYSQEVNGFSVLHAGTRQDGVLASFDNGESWVLNAIGLAQSADLRQSERRIRTMLAVGDEIFIGTHNGVLKQSSGSDQWEQVPGLPEGAIVRSLAVYRDEIYAGLQANGLYRLTGEEGWSPVPGIPAISSVFAFGQAGPEGVLLSAATGLGIWSGNGQNWLKAQVDESASDAWTWTAEGVDGYIYLGTNALWVLRSEDQGYSFRSQDQLNPLQALPLAPIDLTTQGAPSMEVEPTKPEEPAVAESQPTPEPADSVDEMPAATPLPALEAPTSEPEQQPTPEIVPSEPGLISGLNLPLEFLQGDIELPVIGSTSPIVFSVAIILIIIILVGSISVFRHTSEDED